MESWNPPGPMDASGSLDANADVPEDVAASGGPTASASAASEAFGTLANETRLGVLVHLLRAERAGNGPLSFSALQEAVGSESSAGFAYHLRQLDGQFVGKDGDGYVLTAAGRRAAEAVVAGVFTGDDEPRRAS
ncbi:DUF7347 domain-containing protein [Halocalculus aciditolerans]|uniref:DUF7347 domain-containing protein n=1 Tax=Halocalculus aciditolerans TaxID=1383812 RepID=A0A830F3J9_9EURY|nr:helix-turn-helix domain-containing protein [Halocalculus aciditolerans]GGL51643.1 hypothetical protein GCM10009039_07420 [Halocalculus aciditolerans]